MELGFSCLAVPNDKTMKVLYNVKRWLILDHNPRELKRCCN